MLEWNIDRRLISNEEQEPQHFYICSVHRFSHEMSFDLESQLCAWPYDPQNKFYTQLLFSVTTSEEDGVIQALYYKDLWLYNNKLFELKNVFCSPETTEIFLI